MEGAIEELLINCELSATELICVGYWQQSETQATKADMETKQTVRELLDRLPDDCTLEDVLYHLYVVHEVERGLADIEAGNGRPHNDVVRELRQKWSIGTDV